MGAKYTKGQKKATETYMRDKTVLRVVTTKERAERIKHHADPMSISAYINKLIDADMTNNER